MPPHQWPELFNSQYDCLMFGYEESQKKMKEIGRKEVNPMHQNQNEVFMKTSLKFL